MMVTQEFRKWVEGIEEDVKNRLENFATVELKEHKVGDYPLVIHITVLGNGLYTYMDFSQSDYDNNDEEQRHKLVKAHYDYLIQDIEYEVDRLNRVVKAWGAN